MIGFFIRNWKLMLDCVIVVAAILAFTFWDPFNIFNTRKLRQTATLVTSIREIGELVTAEYYGEVIASWKEFKLTEPPVDETQFFAEEMFLNLKQELNNSTRKKVDDAAIRAKAKTEVTPQREETYQKFIAFLGTRYLRRSLDRIYDARDQKVNKNLETRILKNFFDEISDEKDRITKVYKKDGSDKIQDEIDRYLDSIPPYVEEFHQTYSMLTERVVATGPNKRKNIVFIGRGWVKAGFRFNKFDERNFVFDKASKVVHFYGLTPVILDKDINPWFIPERKVKGFELVNYTGDVNFQDAKEVKKLCKEKLLQQAGIEILKRAQENGKDALKSFFSLLLDEPDLSVEFHDIPHQEMYETIASDTLITIHEALAIEKFYFNRKLQIDSIQSREVRERERRFLGQFITRLKELPFIQKNFSFSYYSLGAARILKDSFHIDSADLAMLLAMRGKLKQSKYDLALSTEVVERDSLWFTSGDFIAEYHATLDALSKENVQMPGLHSSDTKSPQLLVSGDSITFNKKPIVVLDTLHEISGIQYRFFYADSLRMNPYYPPDFRFDIINMDPDTTVINELKGKERKKEVYNVMLKKIRDDENVVIISVMENKKRRTEELGPLDKFSKTVRTLADEVKSNLQL
jgi:hypothetical protein